MDKRHTFEDPKPSNAASNHNSATTSIPDPNSSSALSAQDWLDTLSRAKEIALSQSSTTSYDASSSSPYSYSYPDGASGSADPDDAFSHAALLSSSTPSTHTNTLNDTSSEFRAAALRSEGSLGEGLALRGAEQEGGRRERNELRRGIAGSGGGGGSGRVTLQKHHSSHDRDRGVILAATEPDRMGGAGSGSIKGSSGGKVKRFSKRQSKGVLAAVF